MTTFNKPLILAALICPTLAFAQVGVGDVVGTDAPQVLAFLEAGGYTIQEVETEARELEVYAMRDGALFEIEVDLTTGRVAEIDQEHDEDGYDDSDDDA